MPRNPPPDFPFHVEQMSPDGQAVEEILAQASNGIVARAAYQAAVELRPKALIMLRQHTRVIARSDQAG